MNIWTILPYSWIVIVLVWLTVPVVAAAAAASADAAPTVNIFPRGGTATTTTTSRSSTFNGGPVQIFVKTVMDARRHLVAAAGTYSTVKRCTVYNTKLARKVPCMHACIFVSMFCHSHSFIYHFIHFLVHFFQSLGTYTLYSLLFLNLVVHNNSSGTQYLHFCHVSCRHHQNSHSNGSKESFPCRWTLQGCGWISLGTGTIRVRSYHRGVVLIQEFCLGGKARVMYLLPEISHRLYSYTTCLL